MRFALLVSLFALALSCPVSRAAAVPEADTSTPLHAELVQAFSTQINSELAAAYVYLAMASHFAQRNLDGFARWFTVHFYEEVGHARKMIAFLNDKGYHAAFPAIHEAKVVAPRPVDAFTIALRHETEQTGKIHALYEKTKSLKAYDAEVFLHYFVREQVEEEALFAKILEKLMLIGDKSPEGLLALDRELGSRPLPKIE